MNIWTLVKAVLIIFAATTSVMDKSFSEASDFVGWEFVIACLLFFPVIVLSGLFVLKAILRKELDFQTPNWHSNPFDFSHPEHFFHLGGYFMIVSGIGASISMFVETGTSSPAVLTPLAFGVGILGGIWFLKIVHIRQIASSNKQRNADSGANAPPPVR
ncbi:MAG: hypothetical protein GY781_20445 [Gammaproteobacteria bacterium]|nr:hypothetical protein [Gammaproteobacteria bacterium]